MHNYTREDILRLVEEEDVAFIRLQFTDIFGTMKNMAVTVSQLEKALDNRCMFDVSSLDGLSGEADSDMYLYPDLSTFEIFPWRPQQGKVARLICDVYRTDGTPYEVDPRYVIDQYQKPTVEQIYEEIAFVMGTFGYQIEDSDDALADVKLFYTSRRGVRARGVYTGDTFDVLEGSPVDLKVKPKLDRYEKLRQELLASGDLVQDGDGGRLVKTVSFSTPSGAADFVLGGSNNGWIEWKDGDKQTLDALYRK